MTKVSRFPTYVVFSEFTRKLFNALAEGKTIKSITFTTPNNEDKTYNNYTASRIDWNRKRLVAESENPDHKVELELYKKDPSGHNENTTNVEEYEL